MAHVKRTIGLSLGADICWPICFEEILKRLELRIPDGGDTVELEVGRVTIEPFDLQQPCRYTMVIDRLTHWYNPSREWIKKAVILDDLYVLNNPWTLQSMEKQTTYCAMMRLGFPVPRTWMIPPKSYREHADLEPTLRRYARMFDLGKVGEELGYPFFMKPYDGGAWKGVNRIDSEEQLKKSYEESGTEVMHVQKSVEGYDLFARCLGVGPQVRVIPYDPGAPLHGRYQARSDFADAEELRHLRRMTLTINTFFGWDFNSCEALRRDGIFYPIDFANACPDSQVTSLHYHFPWLINAQIRWSVFCAVTRRKMRQNADWEPYYEVARRDLSYEEKLAEYGRIADERLDSDRFQEFCDRHLAHLDEVSWEFFGGDVARGAVRAKVEALFPEHEHEEFTEHFWGLIQRWRNAEAARPRVGLSEAVVEASRQPGERRRFALVAAGLLALAALGFAPRIFELGLLHDDWFYFHEVANGAAPVASPGGLRPLHGLVWRLCGALFGPAIPGYYLVLFALQWLAAALLYLLGRRYAPPAVAAAFAALALLYPADASHLWLSSMPQRTAWLLALGAILCGEWARDRHRAGRPTPAFQVEMAPALALGLASLAVYELHFFLLALWPAAAALLGAPWRRRQLLAWASIPALYLSWRFAWRPSVGGPTVVNTELLFDPVEIARRGALLVPYNLFADGWWIGLLEAFRSPISSGLLFAAAAAAGVCLVGATPASPVATPRWRHFAVAALVLVFGIAPVVPTTYWLGRTAGTFAARILASAVPGAALLLLLALAGIVRRRSPRAAALAALLTLACAFHWNVARLAADNWTVQQRLAEDLRRARHEAAPVWPRESFLVFLDLPPNRLGYDTPWGMGRMIQQATGEATLSGIGIAGDRRPSEILTVSGGDLRVHGGAFATVPLERVVFLRWQPGRLEPAAIPDLPGLR